MITARRAALLLTVLAALALLVAPADAGRRKRKSTKLRSLPAWVQGACARQTPATPGDAVWLHDELGVEVLAEGGVRLSYRHAVRILGERAREHFATVAHLYRRGDAISELSAWTIQRDGTALPIRAKDDVEDRPYIAGFSVFDESRVRYAELPAVRVGSTVAWEYSRTVALDRGAHSVSFGDANRPTLFARATLTVPPGFKLDASVLRGEHLVREDTPETVVLTARDLTPLPPEERRPPARELLPEAWLRWSSPDGKRGFSNWNAVGAWYTELAEGTLRDAGEAAERAAALRPKDPADPTQIEDAIAHAFEFAARDVRYVSIQIGIGGYKPSTPAFVCRNRYGDCKDKTFLFRALLAHAGVRTFPALALTRDAGKVNEEVPTFGQFNHCIPAVLLPEGVGEELWQVVHVDGLGRLLFLDPTASQASPWTLPSAVQGTRAFVVHDGGGTLVELPLQPPGAATTRRTLDARVGPGATIESGTLVETWTGTKASGVRNYWSGQDRAARDRAMLANLQQRLPGVRVTGYEIEDQADGYLALRETTELEGGRLGQRAGPLLILEPGALAFGVLRTLPPPPRRYPLELGPPEREEVRVSLTLPPGLVPEELPAPFTMETPALEAQARWSFADDVLTLELTQERRVSTVAPEEYEAFRAAARRLAGAVRQGIAFVPAP